MYVWFIRLVLHIYTRPPIENMVMMKIYNALKAWWKQTMHGMNIQIQQMYRYGVEFLTGKSIRSICIPCIYAYVAPSKTAWNSKHHASLWSGVHIYMYIKLKSSSGLSAKRICMFSYMKSSTVMQDVQPSIDVITNRTLHAATVCRLFIMFTVCVYDAYHMHGFHDKLNRFCHGPVSIFICTSCICTSTDTPTCYNYINITIKFTRPTLTNYDFRHNSLNELQAFLYG